VRLKDPSVSVSDVTPNDECSCHKSKDENTIVAGSVAFISGAREGCVISVIDMWQE
jgi:hypothetical protein